MRTFLWIFLFYMALPVNKAFCQYEQYNSSFSIEGMLNGRDTGFIVLWYFDDHNYQVSDTVKLHQGKFHFSGTVNHACEALLWTNLSRRSFDDPSVVRFLLEPTNIKITYNLNDPLNPVIKGSELQAEKENWDNKKYSLLSAKAEVYKLIFALSDRSDTTGNSRIGEKLTTQRDSINELIAKSDLEYINGHPSSYLSGYLLSKHQKRLPIDTTEAYYNKLGGNVKSSRLGRDVLAYIYPLTDNFEFRKANPLGNSVFSKNLYDIKSIYDLSFKDTLGNLIKLSSFKRKYLVIDFWASWCKPCVENIPSLNRLSKDFKSDSIQFVSISVDDDLTKWKSSIASHDFSGIQLLDTVGFGGLAATYLKVIFVPSYIVTDPNGKVITYNAPQASDPELKILLTTLLKKKR